MSITTSLPGGPHLPPEPVWPLTVQQYHAMIRAGILNEDDPIELLEGHLVQKMPKNPLHSFVTEALREAAAAVLPEGFIVRSQEPVTLPTSEPELDITIARGKRIDYAKRHPGPA